MAGRRILNRFFALFNAVQTIQTVQAAGTAVFRLIRTTGKEYVSMTATIRISSVDYAVLQRKVEDMMDGTVKKLAVKAAFAGLKALSESDREKLICGGSDLLHGILIDAINKTAAEYGVTLSDLRLTTDETG